MAVYSPDHLDNYLKDYYKKLFPFKHYTKWLCYNQKSSEYFGRREFAFILKEDVHLRYRSFALEADFEKDLCERAPHKLDLGAVYNHCPKDHRKHTDFRAVEREFVLDIDLTDYDGVRTCCSEAKVCKKCWRFIALAVKILDDVLDDHFGFSARLWVFSGRRGVHCWIGDEKARKLNNTQRAALAEYMSLMAGDKLNLNTGSSTKKAQIMPLIALRAYRTAVDSGIVEKMVEEQGWLSDANLPSILAKIEDAQLKSTIKAAFEKIGEDDVKNRWRSLLLRFDKEAREKSTIKTSEVPESSKWFLLWFVLYHVYPRLDVNVSTGLNHLLKSPFCIHPKTGNVAVPLDVDTIEQFDVDQAPRIDLILRQLPKDQAAQQAQENRKILWYKQTDLAPFVENFEKFVEKAVGTNTTGNALQAQNL